MIIIMFGYTYSIFDKNTRYNIGAEEKRVLAFMLNDTGVFGKVQNAFYAYNEYHYHFNNYIDYSQDYSLYDDVYLNNKLIIGGKVRGYTLNGSVTLDANNYGGYFHFIMFDHNYVSFNDIEKYFSLFPIFFVKHKIYIYNPNGYVLSYQDTNQPDNNEDIISSSETDITEFNFWIDYDSLGKLSITGYNYDYYYILEKVNSDGTSKKYRYKKNWNR